MAVTLFVVVTATVCGAGALPPAGALNVSDCGETDNVAACGATTSDTGTVTVAAPDADIVRVPVYVPACRLEAFAVTDTEPGVLPEVGDVDNHDPPELVAAVTV